MFRALHSYLQVHCLHILSIFVPLAHGGSIIEMQFVTSLGALIITGFTWLSMQFWASLVTNRELLGGLLKLYQLLLILHFAIVLWSINALGATFEDTDWRTEEAAVKKIYPSYCATIIVTAFYLPILIYYGLNISYYCETMLKTGGVIEEPDVDPDEVYDLSDYTLLQFLLMPLAIPILIMIKLKEAIEECLYHTKRWIDHRRAIYEASQKKRKSIGHRIKKTFKKWYKYLKEMISPVKPQSQPAVVVPVSPSSLSELRSLNAAIDADLAPPETEAEKAERIQEEERKKEEERVAKAKEAADRKQREKEEELRKKMEEERKKQEEQQAKLDEEERIRKERETAAVLSKDMYKEYWGSMKPAGSFQCKLKVPPNVDKFAEHLAKQGFHVVFSQNTNSAAECEVGICNIRGDGEPGTGTGPWFLARFVAGKNAFSAVMKCEDAAIVTTFVKKFALAKILKIDTSS